MEKTLCTFNEYKAVQDALESAKEQLDFARQAELGTAVYESIPQIEGRIRWSQEFLDTHEPSEDAESEVRYAGPGGDDYEAFLAGQPK